MNFLFGCLRESADGWVHLSFLFVLLDFCISVRLLLALGDLALARIVGSIEFVIDIRCLY